VLRAALTQRPGYPAATLELARNEIASSRMRDAETHLESLVRSRPSWVDAQALLGRTRLLLGDPGGALAPLRAAVRQRPDLESARSDLAWAMMGHAGRPAPRRSLSGFSA
jgi:predicted Zn-dependent protease